MKKQAYTDPSQMQHLLNKESWKVFQIMAEFVEGFEQLATISPSVSIFGSARTKPRVLWKRLIKGLIAANQNQSD